MLASMLRVARPDSFRLAFLAVCTHDESNRGKLDSESVIEIGSSFKAFVLAAILHLVEKGRLDLRDQIPVSREHVCEGSPIFANLGGREVSVEQALVAMLGRAERQLRARRSRATQCSQEHTAWTRGRPTP
jgi:hypothetical protein